MTFYDDLTRLALAHQPISESDCHRILKDPELNLLLLLQAAYQVRYAQWENKVHIHVINNAQNGNCPEDCKYCAQAKSSDSDIQDYPLKSDEEILEEARQAYESGAFRYCMVFAGRGPRPKRVEKLASLIQEIKAKYPIEVCVSAGLLDEQGARQLKEAGLDRLNHNLNTSQSYYNRICSTHDYQDRMNTLKAGKSVGLSLCSGVIVGMGETDADIIQVAQELRQLEVPSIPVNFYMPIEGTPLGSASGLSPQYCLRVLCLFRFLNPKSELRVSAGREFHLRSLEVMSLYPANSLFLDGYLNAKGSQAKTTLQMIKDAGFTICSDFSVDDVLGKTTLSPELKSLKDLKKVSAESFSVVPKT